MGRLPARAAAARAGSERAWHALERTVLKALEDSEGALRGWVAAQQVLQRAVPAEQVARAAAGHSAARAGSGLEPTTQALEYQLAHLRARRSTLATRADAIERFAQAQIALAAWQPEARP